MQSTKTKYMAKKQGKEVKVTYSYRAEPALMKAVRKKAKKENISLSVKIQELLLNYVEQY